MTNGRRKSLAPRECDVMFEISATLLRGAKATKQSLSLCSALDCFAEAVIGRAFAGPVGSQ
jgi:hypothetical protein